MCIYVDDILLATKDQVLLRRLVKSLNGKFDARHLGSVGLYYGMIITRGRTKRVMYSSELQKIENML